MPAQLRRRTCRLLPFALLLLLPAVAGAAGPACKAGDSFRQQGPERVGEEVSVQLRSPSVADGSGTSSGSAPSGWVWREELSSPGASYIAPHFERFDLPPGARLIVRSPDGRRSRAYDGHGKGDLGVKEGFWGMHIPGDTVLIELYASVPVPEGAVRLRGFARGYPAGEESWKVPPGPKAICGIDDSQWAQCLQESEPTIYDKSRTVARLLIQGVGSCTGWLVGDSGHLLTNAHCIGSATAAANTDYVFMAESACVPNCSGFSCSGVVEADSSTLVKADDTLDYALVELPTNLTGTYGFLQLRESGAELEERIYIPGHPGGAPKRIADVSTHPADASGKCEVFSLSEFPCFGGSGTDVGYFCDTQGGSSGSPVLGYGDHLVVALHHCAGCPNVGVPIQSVIADLGPSLPPSSLGGACTRPPVPVLTATPTFGGILLSWPPAAGATGYQIYRSKAPGGPYTLLATAAGTSHLDTDTGEQCNRPYHYYIRALATCPSYPSAVASAFSGLCPPCSEVTLYSNGFEGSGGLSDWSVSSFLSGDTPDWQGVQACTAQSGSHIFRFGGATCDASYSNSQYDYAWPSQGFAIPAGAASSHLSFAHRWSFENGNDGGSLMISVDGAYLVRVPATALSGATYTTTAYPSCPLAGVWGLPIFSGEQGSFVTTDVDLDEACQAATGSGCAGHIVQVAFVAVTNCDTAQAGWFLDDVAVRSCVVPPAPPASFHTLTPCRLVDTRNPSSPLGGPALHNGTRVFVSTGTCGIPATAKALSLNLTVTQQEVSGFLALSPDGWPAPSTSAINFSPGETRANNSIVGLGSNGAFRVRASGGPVHVIVDVNGYFE